MKFVNDLRHVFYVLVRLVHRLLGSRLTMIDKLHRDFPLTQLRFHKVSYTDYENDVFINMKTLDVLLNDIPPRSLSHEMETRVLGHIRFMCQKPHLTWETFDFRLNMILALSIALEQGGIHVIDPRLTQIRGGTWMDALSDWLTY